MTMAVDDMAKAKPRIAPKPSRTNRITQTAVAARMTTMARRIAETSMVTACGRRRSRLRHSFLRSNVEPGEA